MGRLDCLDEETLLGFLGLGSAVAAGGEVDSRAIHAHLASCSECRQLVVALAEQRPSLGGEHAPTSGAPSAEVRANVRDLIELVDDHRVGGLVAEKWTIEALLGEGGMGRVYRARHVNGHPVAIKFLRSGLADRPEIVRRFRREGYVANRVNHPAVVKVLDDGEDRGPFLVMELLEGRSCRDAIRDSALSASQALTVIEAAAAALGAAHRVGIVHRDIKPDNVFLASNGQVRLLDFGLASVREAGGPLANASMTADGVTMGTVGYMAPEQARGDNAVVGARSDVWSLAATCVALVTGKTVHGGATPAEELAFAITRQVPPVRSMTGAFPLSVERVLDQALSFDPAARPADASAFLEALVQARRDAHAAATLGAGRRGLMWIVLAAGGAMAALLALLGLHRTSSPAPSGVPERAMAEVAPVAPAIASSSIDFSGALAPRPPTAFPASSALPSADGGALAKRPSSRETQRHPSTPAFAPAPLPRPSATTLLPAASASASTVAPPDPLAPRF